MSDANSSMIESIDHISKVRAFMEEIVTHLRRREMNHDASKLEEPELSGYAGLSDALKGLEYGTPEYRVAFGPFKPIIKHHYLYNDHHPEHFQNGINDMDLIQIIEMLADWKAASTRNSDTLKATLGKTLERFGVDGQLATIIRTTVDALGW